MELSLLHSATGSNLLPAPEWVIPEDVEVQGSEEDRAARNHLPLFNVLPHEHHV